MSIALKKRIAGLEDGVLSSERFDATLRRCTWRETRAEVLKRHNVGVDAKVFWIDRVLVEPGACYGDQPIIVPDIDR